MDQKKNIVGGHLAGRDVNVTNLSTTPATFMNQLQQRFEDQRAKNSKLLSLIDSLQYYQVPIDEAPIGLENKLALGNRALYVGEALRLKELFVKLMAKYNLYEAAQVLIAYCLGEIESLFQGHVVPLLNNAAKQHDVDAALNLHVIQPVLQLLEVNFLYLTPQDLKGMVYYLTANCFLQWHPKESNANLPPSA